MVQRLARLLIVLLAVATLALIGVWVMTNTEFGRARARNYLLGLLSLETGDLALAIAELETAARMLPDNAQFQFALGNAYARAGRAEDAARARAAFMRLKN